MLYFQCFFALFIWLLKWMWFCGNQQMSPRRLQIGRYTQFGDGEGWKAIAAINIKFDPWEANKKIGVITQVEKAVKIQTGIFLNYYVVTGQPLQPYRVGLTSLFQPPWLPNVKDLDDCLDIPQKSRWSESPPSYLQTNDVDENTQNHDTGFSPRLTQFHSVRKKRRKQRPIYNIAQTLQKYTDTKTTKNTSRKIYQSRNTQM